MKGKHVCMSIAPSTRRLLLLGMSTFSRILRTRPFTQIDKSLLPSHWAHFRFLSPEIIGSFWKSWNTSIKLIGKKQRYGVQETLMTRRLPQVFLGDSLVGKIIKSIGWPSQSSQPPLGDIVIYCLKEVSVYSGPCHCKDGWELERFTVEIWVVIA